jgi:hypothetical protein
MVVKTIEETHRRRKNLVFFKNIFYVESVAVQTRLATDPRFDTVTGKSREMACSVP